MRLDEAHLCQSIQNHRKQKPTYRKRKNQLDIRKSAAACMAAVDVNRPEGVRGTYQVCEYPEVPALFLCGALHKGVPARRMMRIRCT